MRLILAIAVVLLFTTCTKFGKNISITGFVRNPVTGQAYEGIKIKLMRTDGGLPGGYKDIEAFYTNADGYFEIHHYGAYKSYYLGVDLDKEVYIKGWYEDGVYVGDGRMNVEKGRYMHPVLDLVEYSYSKLIINNVNCQGPNDKFVLYRSNQIGSIDGSFGWEHLGCAYWETNGYSDIPMGNVYYRWEVTRNGVTNIYTDTVYYPAGEYTTYTINY